MSIQGAFYSSLTSLNLQQTQIGLISNNIANATTPGYSAQKVDPTSIVQNGKGQGVATGTVQRVTDQALTRAANLANGAQTYSGAMSAGLGQYSAAITKTTTGSDGVTVSANVLTASLSSMQSAMTALSASPGTATAQTAVVSAAQGVATAFNGVNDAIATARENADAGVASDVTAVNQALDGLAANERDIAKARALGQSTAGLEDRRDQYVSTLSGYLPVSVLPNGNGSIAVVTDGGDTLYQGDHVNHLSFSATSNIPSTLGVQADASKGISAGLSQVTVNGSVLRTSENGSIAANLNLRDKVLPQFSDQVDQLAGNIVSTFQNVDPTVTATTTGLFTSNGSRVGAGTTTAGLAGTLSVNAAVDPSQGGSAWRVQYGVQAATQGQKSDAATLNKLIGGMSASAAYTPSAGIGSADMVSASSQIAGSQQSAYSTWSGRNDARSAQYTTAQTALSASTGVNVDEQMQRLLLIQQTYAASAQVIQAAAQMLQTLNSAVGGAR